jgi:hypothetical protein
VRCRLWLQAYREVAGLQQLASGALEGEVALSSSRAAGRAVEVIHTNNDLDGRLVISSHTNNARAAVPMETV